MNYFFIKKQMKLSKYLILAIASIFFISGCTSVKETLSGQKKENTDEFLVKKKNPLVLPPNFDELPQPQLKDTEIEDQDQNIDFSGVLSDAENKNEKVKNDNSSLEKSISEILNSN